MKILIFSLCFITGFGLILTLIYLGFLGLLLDDYQKQYTKSKKVEPSIHFIFQWKIFVIGLYILYPINSLEKKFSELDEVKWVVSHIKKGRKIGIIMFGILMASVILITILFKK